MNSIKIIVEAILEKEKHGHLCPDTIEKLNHQKTMERKRPLKPKVLKERFDKNEKN